MVKVGITSSLFLIGVILALITVANLNRLNFSFLNAINPIQIKQAISEASSRSAAIESEFAGGAAADRASLSRPAIEADGRGDRGAPAKSDFSETSIEMVYSPQTSRAEQIEILSKALSSGSLRALQYLRPEFLNKIPEYRSEILPVLKRHAAESLLKRFSEEDWKGWLNSGTVLAGKPTAAFMYGVDVYLVNRELGRYVFTSGYLFHRAWVRASAGERYYPSEEINLLARDSSRMNREVSTGIYWSDLVDPAVGTDAAVIGFLDNIRFRLVERALSSEANNDVRAVNLLTDLPNTPLPDSTVKAVGAFIRRISAAGDAATRNSLVGMEHESQSLSHLAINHPQLKTPIAYLLLAVALDLHEQGERTDAVTAAEFARRFDPLVLSDDEMALFSGERQPAKSSVSKTSRTELAARPAAGTKAEKEPAGARAADVEKGDRPAFRLGGGQQLAEEGQSEIAEAAPAKKRSSFPFGLLIVAALVLGGMFFIGRILVNRVRERFGEAEFTDFSKTEANADFTLGESINVLHGNQPPR